MLAMVQARKLAIHPYVCSVLQIYVHLTFFQDQYAEHRLVFQRPAARSISATRDHHTAVATGVGSLCCVLLSVQ
ncbi:hypothetical protein ATP06_0234220 [Amycolatopsis regifaucium]|uniref:Secreted protein n=1 Tax=Amycolatopsis regifaucium TaxID=546365 RepID=A0ABX3DIS8_9PSEU|nr:hypothetical protein ATP06_0234220 [Amycolatopsis regifaucium]